MEEIDLEELKNLDIEDDDLNHPKNLVKKLLEKLSSKDFSPKIRKSCRKSLMKSKKDLNRDIQLPIVERLSIFSQRKRTSGFKKRKIPKIRINRTGRSKRLINERRKSNIRNLTGKKKRK